ncbi:MULTISPECIES: hypothetical protein [Myroides]|uniref:hypothetical protein n=1 Tax=Myroides TaxID=76831 RepID=UPI00310190D9
MRKTIFYLIVLLVLTNISCSNDDNKSTKTIPKPDPKELTLLESYTEYVIQENVKTKQKYYRTISNNELFYNKKGQITSLETYTKYTHPYGQPHEARSTFEYFYNDKDQLNKVVEYIMGKEVDYNYITYTLHYDNQNRIDYVILNGIKMEFKYDTKGHLLSNIRNTFLTTYKTDEKGNITQISNDKEILEQLKYDNYNSPFKNLPTLFPFNNRTSHYEIPFAYREQNNITHKEKYNTITTYKYNSNDYPIESIEILPLADDKYESNNDNYIDYRKLEFKYKTIP